MTMETETFPPKPPKRRRRCLIIGLSILTLILLFFIIILVLALTVFKVKEPEIHVVSASLQGVSPRVSFPVINIELNITLNITLLVHNPNYASLRHGGGKTYLYYRDKEVGDADLYPGFIPSRGSSNLLCKLNLQVDEFAGDLTGLIQDVLSGELVLETRTRIPGRVKIVGIRKHVVAVSACSFDIAFPSMKIQDQKCKSKTKF
ncbi:Late embryogenesis abundant (LEA) hydroxyproline-rich glycoprotein family [Euphorbia peplus]|nr:Late embryogenesis abundant (LEA) hydroxyproline-rich glycoprotein family [Euphorbia peplus]